MGFGTYLPKISAEVAEQAKEGLARAWEAGVRLAAGTDADNPRASISKECELFTEIGMSPLEALRAATSIAAQVLRQPDIGSIELGKIADLVVVAGDPTQSITDLAEVRVVIQSGAIVHQVGVSA